MTIPIICAPVLFYTGYFFQIGKSDFAYYGLLIMLVISLITVFTMWNIPDANLADRGYAGHKE